MTGGDWVPVGRRRGLSSDGGFGVCSFFVRLRNKDRYGANGLPLTPASVRVLGRFQRLKTFHHERLCQYLELQRSSNDRVFLVSEHYRIALADRFTNFNEVDCAACCSQILDGLSYLHRNNIIAGYLLLDSVQVVSENPLSIRLTQYGLNHATNYGEYVDFPIGALWRLPPETRNRVQHSGGVCRINAKVDAWLFGLLLFELQTKVALDTIWNEFQILGVIETSIKKGDTLFTGLFEAFTVAKGIDVNTEFKTNVISRCLTLLPSKRPSIAELMAEFVSGETGKPVCRSNRYFINSNDVFQPETRFRSTQFESILELRAEADRYYSAICRRPIEEIYYLWKLAGSDLETILTRKGLIKSKPPVCTLPNVCVSEFEIFGNEEMRATVSNLSLVPLSCKNLTERLESYSETRFILSMELKYGRIDADSNGSQSSSRMIAATSNENQSCLPTVVKERDIDYQVERMMLMERFVAIFPVRFGRFEAEANVDVPPVYRPFVWAALLGVRHDVEIVWKSIDKETPTSTDRQIEVDIPRCHQYDELLASPAAHRKLKRLLKAWVVSHPQYVYWQGLDSLAAPFLYLHFNNEPLAFACLCAFIPRYLHKFFLKDNSAIIQEYLTVFNHLIAFHDPVLFVHLTAQEFVPELYAIPWFLTMFAHVLPLSKLFHLWDRLLLGDSSFSLCVGVAVLQQLRPRLLTYGFNECILLFSDLPEIEIGRCVDDSTLLYARTPVSVTFRQHASPEDRKRLATVDNGNSPLSTMTALSVSELKQLACCRMGAAEFDRLSNDNSNKQLRILPVDVRPADEYNRGSLTDSISIPYNTTGDGIVAGSAWEQLKHSNGDAVIVIVDDSRMTRAYQFASDLINQGFARVCVLENGIDAYKQTSALTVRPSL